MKHACVDQFSLVLLDTEVENLRAALDKALADRAHLRRMLRVEDCKIQHLRKELHRARYALRRANMREE